MADEVFQLKDNKQFKDLLKRTKKLLKKELNYLDKVLENAISKTHSIPAATSHFTKEIAQKLFGRRAELVQHDYKALLKNMTFSRVSEKSLRRYYLKIIAKEFEYDFERDECNLDDLAKHFIRATNSWLRRIDKDDEATADLNRIVNEHMDGDPKRFVDALRFFVMVIVLSNVALGRLGTGKFKKYSAKLTKIVSSAFYGHTLSKKQYKFLKGAGLEGGIIFKGESLDLDRALALVKKGKLSKASSWTTDYNEALGFALKFIGEEAGIDPQNVRFIDSIAKYKKLYVHFKGRRKYLTVFVDSVSVLTKILDFLKSESAKNSKLEAGACVVLSHLAVHKSGFYVGEKGAYVGSVPREKEVIFRPTKFKPKDNTIDAYVVVMYQ